MMTKISFTFLFIYFIVLDFGYAQTVDRLYRTEEGVVFTQNQFDSLMSLGNSIGKMGEKVINDTTFMIIRAFSLEEIKPMTAKYKGKPLPEITLSTIDGRTITSNDLKGKVVMINFWATTCGPCIIEIPELNRLQEDYKDKVVFLAPLPQDKAKAAKFLVKYPFKFTIAPNSTDVFEQLGIDGYPKNFFVNRDGIIQEVKEGTPRRRDSPDGEWYVSVYEDYSAILDEMLNSH